MSTNFTFGDTILARMSDLERKRMAEEQADRDESYRASQLSIEDKRLQLTRDAQEASDKHILRTDALKEEEMGILREGVADSKKTVIPRDFLPKTDHRFLSAKSLLDPMTKKDLYDLVDQGRKSAVADAELDAANEKRDYVRDQRDLGKKEIATQLELEGLVAPLRKLELEYAVSDITQPRAKGEIKGAAGTVFNLLRFGEGRSPGESDSDVEREMKTLEGLVGPSIPEYSDTKAFEAAEYGLKLATTVNDIISNPRVPPGAISTAFEKLTKIRNILEPAFGEGRLPTNDGLEHPTLWTVSASQKYKAFMKLYNPIEEFVTATASGLYSAEHSRISAKEDVETEGAIARMKAKKALED